MIEILVVEDSELFRRNVLSIIQERPDLRVICEVADGLQGVQRAAELQPDLVLLDIGLPTLNGIEVARQIRISAPHSHIVFLTQESSSEFVNEAFDLGAKGYIVKGDSRRDLLIGIDAVCGGETFVSSSLGGNGLKKGFLGRNPSV